jgi:hypothetical protein
VTIPSDLSEVATPDVASAHSHLRRIAILSTHQQELFSRKNDQYVNHHKVVNLEVILSEAPRRHLL